ncbi:hypothetical protein [Gracilimonas sp. BCB1]|uniref:hypothetical protein n=1 Tax=Gracilimonas sp. BCB1 TaxID=3152362 RepID=UPI0032D92FD2
MKTAFAIFMTMHGLIHLLGFLKAFQLVDIKDFKQPISKQAGVFWMISSILVISAVNLYLAGNSYYIGFGFTAILISQILITGTWEDAKYGTIPNILFGILLLLSFQ